MAKELSAGKRALFFSLMVGITLLLCFAILEVGLGRFAYSNVLEVSDKRFDPILGWHLAPGTYWLKPAHSFRKHPIHVNSLGLRGPEVPQDRDAQGPPDTLNILLLGDSFTYAEQFPREEIFATLVGDRLNAEGSPPVRVLNVGTPGYGTAQELLLFRRLTEEQRVRCDVCVLVIFTNDILDNLRLSRARLEPELVRPGFELDESGRPRLVHLPVNERGSESLVPVERLRTKFKAGKVIREKLRIAMQNKPELVAWMQKIGVPVEVNRMPGVINAWYREEITGPGVPLMTALVAEVRRVAEMQGAVTLACFIPSPLQVYPDTYDRLLEKSFPGDEFVAAFLADRKVPQQFVSGICRDAGVPLLDLYPVLYANNHRELYIPADGHFTATAHALVADEIARYLREELGRARPERW